jgi:cob(I)alamin adenosyltransferase
MTKKTEKELDRGLLIVYTGNGKGKTTAALGMCVRAVGYGWNICIIQFVKGSWKYGELKGLKRLEPEVELHVVGEGFVGIIDDDKDFEEHCKAARDGLVLAGEKLQSDAFQLVILDELNVALELGLVKQDDVADLLKLRTGKDAKKHKKNKKHLVITGRGAPDWLLAEADLVTEMKEIKHPFRQGIEAQKGIDW